MVRTFGVLCMKEYPLQRDGRLVLMFVCSLPVHAVRSRDPVVLASFFHVRERLTTRRNVVTLLYQKTK